MYRTPRKILIKSIGIIFFIFILVFAYSRFGRYLQGPEIVRISVQENTTIEALHLELYGAVINTESIHINGRMVQINNDLSFNEIIVLSPGKNMLDIRVQDSFGKTEDYVYTLYSTVSGEFQISKEEVKDEEETLTNNT